MTDEDATERARIIELSVPTYVHRLTGSAAHGTIFLGDRVLSEAGLLSMMVEDDKGNVVVSVMDLREARRLHEAINTWIVRQSTPAEPVYRPVHRQRT